MATAAAPSKPDCPPTVQVPDCILCVCRDYRKVFASDEAMAEALSIELRVARAMLVGNVYPNLDVMIRVQDGIRKASVSRPVLG